MYFIDRAFTCLCFLGWLVTATPHARADVGLIVETPTGVQGFVSDVGHSSLWISHGCLNEQGEVRFCEHTPGIVLTSTAYWPKPGVAAIPAELFFLGVRPGTAGRSAAAWNDSLAVAYPNVDPETGRKYLGRVWRRGMRVTTFTTTAEQDRRVLETVQQQRQDYRYSYSHRNCAFYAEQILKLYLGDDFHANRSFDLGIETPRALERALGHRLEGKHNASLRVLSFKGTLWQGWRQPPRTFCETAVLDPKYAIPLIVFQPYIYVGFGVCYAVTRLTAATWKNHHRPAFETPAWSPALWVDITTGPDPRVTSYQMLTGDLPANSPWLSAPIAPSSPFLEQAHTPSSSPVF